MIELTLIELISRIIGAIIFGGIVGYDREVKGQSAGFRTHIIVSVGAAMFALIQIKTTNQIIDIALNYPDLLKIFSMDQTRFIAQVISGIGFLGAGTIVVTKKSISGLTTAASIWATAALGIAIGMGYYEIALVGAISIVAILSFVKKYLSLPAGRNLIIQYTAEDFKVKLVNYFEQNDIKYHSTEFRIERDFDRNQMIYSEHFVLHLPKDCSLHQVMRTIGQFEEISYISSQPHIV